MSNPENYEELLESLLENPDSPATDEEKHMVATELHKTFRHMETLCELSDVMGLNVELNEDGQIERISFED